MLTKKNGKKNKTFLSFQGFLLAIFILPIFLTGITFALGSLRKDRTPPTTPVVIDDGQYTTSLSQLHATWSSSDPESGISEYQYCIGMAPGSTDVVGWTSAGLDTEATVSGLSLTQGQSYYFNVNARNGTSLWSEVGSSDGITVGTGQDTTPPVGSITIDNGDGYTTNLSVVLSLDAQDDIGSVSEMDFSNDNTNWAGPEPYSTTKNWFLEDDIGTKTVYVKYSDTAGNWSNSFSDQIYFDDTPPIITAVVDDGVTTYETTQLHASWSAQDESSITEYQYAIGTTQGQSGNDIQDWTSTGLNTEATATGLTLGPGQAYYFNVKAKNTLDLWSSVGSSDGITVLTQDPPEITSLTPGNNSTFIEADIIDIAVQAQGGPPLEYRYLINGVVIGDWTLSNTYSWQTQAGDIKQKTITVAVRDQFQATDSQDISVFLFRRVPKPD